MSDRPNTIGDAFDRRSRGYAREQAASALYEELRLLDDDALKERGRRAGVPYFAYSRSIMIAEIIEREIPS